MTHNVFWPLERDAMSVLDDMTHEELSRVKLNKVLLSVYNDELLFRREICGELAFTPVLTPFARAIHFLLDRGFFFDEDYPSWANYSPEHYQPTDGEHDTAMFIDRHPMDYNALVIHMREITLAKKGQ